MNTFVIDASIAVKWVVDEDGTPEALTLRQRAKLIAPELLVAECANILWKKVQRDELLKQEALLAQSLTLLSASGWQINENRCAATIHRQFAERPDADRV